MDRNASLQVIASDQQWDIAVIGGGATGLGIAVDAATRGYRTVLLEQHDFAKATSSRSTKLIHGGVRYLQQGNLKLVRESLHERGNLLRNAPHLVSPLGFVVPCFHWWEKSYYRLGMAAYDLLAGKLNIAPSRGLTRAETIEGVPTLNPTDLRGGVLYYDAQFDDARLAICLARTAATHGASLANYVRVTSLEYEGKTVSGLRAIDLETATEYRVRAHSVINATGIFTDSVCRLDNPEWEPHIAYSQGIHLVLDRSFLPGNNAILIPKTEDGRVLFIIPWHDHVLLGTTDTPVVVSALEPRPQRDEIDFLLRHAARYLTKAPQAADVRSVFAGIRPLFKASGKGAKTSAISRDHVVLIADSGLITIAGGKWTTYRKMAEDAVDTAARVASLRLSECRTAQLALHGAGSTAESVSAGSIDLLSPSRTYGTDTPAFDDLIRSNPLLGNILYPGSPYRGADVVWGTRYEMARTVEDILARRTRSLLLDARGSIEAAPRVASLMAQELGLGRVWEEEQVEAFQELAKQYLLDCGSSGAESR